MGLEPVLDLASIVLRRLGDRPTHPIWHPGVQLLRSDPRFAEVLAASHDGAAKIARILGEARTRGELPAYLDQPLGELERLLSEPPG